MASFRACDHCHQTVGDNDLVTVSVNNLAVMKHLRAKADPALRNSVADRHHIHLDLHERCYDEVVAPTLERIGI